jgi:hypothetical protein
MQPKQTMSYRKEFSSKKYGIGVIVFATFIVGLLFSIYYFVFQQWLGFEERFGNSDNYFVLGILLIIYAGFLYLGITALLSSRNWLYEVNSRFVIMHSPGWGMGSNCELHLTEIKKVVFKVEKGSDGNSRYYVVDKNDKEYWISTNAAIDAKEFAHEIIRANPETVFETIEI